MRVLLVDDHAIVRTGLKQILQAESDKYEVGEASDRNSALEALRQNKWDAVVLDINLPGRNGIEILKEVKRIWPELPVLILSMHSEDEYAIRAMKSGAAGYLTKETAAESLVEALEKVVTGGKYITPAVAEKLVDIMHSDQGELAHESLSDREFEVLRGLAEGNSVSQIADNLHLSVKTISTYRTRLIKKLGVSNNLEIIRYAMRHGIIQTK